MEEQSVTGAISKDSILSGVMDILKDMTADWDLDFSGGIRPTTGIIDGLGFESIDVVQLVGAIEEKFGRRGLPFHELLMKDENYVDEITVFQIVDFLHVHLG